MADAEIAGKVTTSLDPSGIKQGADQAEKELKDLEKNAAQSTANIAKTTKKDMTDVRKAMDEAIGSIGNSRKRPKRTREEISAQAEAKREREAMVWLANQEKSLRDRMGRMQEQAYREDALRTRKKQETVERDRVRSERLAERQENQRQRRQLVLANAANRELAKEESKRRQAEEKSERDRVKALEKRQREELRLERQAQTESRKLQRASEREEARLRRETRRQANAEIKAFAKEQRRFEVVQEREANTERKRLVRVQRAEEREISRDTAAIQRVQSRIMSAPAALQAQILGSLQGTQAVAMRRTLMGSGMNRQQAIAFQAQQVQGINRQTGVWLAGGGGIRPPQFGGRVPAGGPGGGPGSWRGMLGRAGSAFASGLGIGVGGFGAYAAAQGARELVEQTKVATAYERQQVAAENLAASQAKLNELLDAYADASGNAVDKVTTLSNVTRLMATGFANNAEEVETFVRATRGASIALGKPQDYVIQETQLAISNTSVKRLDQIGLGITEVNDRIEKLRATNADWSRETAFQQAVLGLMDEKYGNLTRTVEGQATGVERLARAWADLRLEMGKEAKGPVDSIAGFVAEMFDEQAQRNAFYDRYSSDPAARPDINASELERDVFERSERRRERADNFTAALDKASHALNRWALELYGQDYDALLAAQGPQFRDPVPAWMTSASGSAMAPPPRLSLSGYKEESHDIIRAAFDAEQAIIKNAYDQRNAQIAQYEEQRTKMVADFAKNMAREEEDFYRQRARSQRDYERSIVDMMRETQEREADMQEDLDDRVADLREDSEERIADIQEKHNKDREKAEKDHRDRLMKAAGQLDAIAVLEERKRFREENKEREEAHREAVDEQRESLAEQIEEAREAHAEQLEDAREADAKRLEDMRVSRAQQIADENEDRALRLARAQEDHDAQVAELDRQHELTLERIADEAEAEREALADALEKDLAEVGVYIAGYHKKMEERDRLVETWIDSMIARMEMEIAQDAHNDERGGSTGNYRYDPKHGPIIPTDYGAAINSSSVSYGGVTNSKVITIQTGAIQVTAQPGMELYIANLVEERVIELMEEY